jgi:hypothetical protein
MAGHDSLSLLGLLSSLIIEAEQPVPRVLEASRPEIRRGFMHHTLAISRIRPTVLI